VVAAGQALAHHSFTAEYDSTRKTTGPNPKSWIDHAGRPHSDQLRVAETYHRVDHDNMEPTLQIVDPKMYTEPWLALNKFPLHLQPADFDYPRSCSVRQRK
jgi:hypothetical protein